MEGVRTTPIFEMLLCLWTVGDLASVMRYATAKVRRTIHQ